MPIDKQKLKDINNLKEQLSKHFKKDVLFTGTEAIDKGIFDKVIIPTSSIELNNALWCGGVGGIVELFGPPGGGKTSLAIEILAEAQKRDPNFTGLWLETEHSIFPEILIRHGIDPDRLLYLAQEDLNDADNALDVVVSTVERGLANMVIVNSVAGLLPAQEKEDSLTKQGIALTARLMSKLFRKITGAAGKNKTTMIFINQIRDKVGVMFGDPATTTGGKALQFYANQRIRLNRLKIDKADPITDEEGVKVSCIIYKNRWADGHNPYTKCEYYARYDTGIDSIVAIPQTLADKGIFVQKGAWWYSYEEGTDTPRTIEGIECKFNSKNAFINALRENENFRNALMKYIEVNNVSASVREEIEREEEETTKALQEMEALDSEEE